MYKTLILVAAATVSAAVCAADATPVVSTTETKTEAPVETVASEATSTKKDAAIDAKKAAMVAQTQVATPAAENSDAAITVN